MRTTVRVGGVIHAEAPRIYACLSDYKQAAHFIDGLDSLMPVSDAAGEGARYDAVMKVGPKTFSATIEIAALIENSLVTWSSTEADGRSLTFKLKAVPQGTQVVLEISYEKPTGITGSLAAPVIEEAVRARAHSSMRRLRDHVT